VNQEAVTFTSTGGVFVGTSNPVLLGSDILLSTANPASLQDLSVVLGYRLS
jgi:hypothetical protein